MLDSSLQYVKYILFFLLVIIHVKSVRAQSVASTLNAAGNTYTQADVTYEWSVGELAIIETLVNSKAVITNGLLQPVPPALIVTNALLVTPPNILSANGDGKNDTWVIKDLDKYPDNEVTVFDRAGRTVFHAKNYQNDWTGNLSGVPLAEDTYYYLIQLKKAGQSGLVKGFITILK